MSANPSIKIKTTFRGGAKFNQFMTRAQAPAKFSGYKVGWPTDSFYDAGKEKIFTAEVAKIHEFGNNGMPVGHGAIIPERPFFRAANEKFHHHLAAFIKFTCRQRGGLDMKGAHFLAQRHVQFVKDSIQEWSYPANADSTVRRKKMNDPLIETGQMMADVDYNLTKR